MVARRKDKSREIYALTGRKGHGKDSLARLIAEVSAKPPHGVRANPFEIVHLADPLKRMAGRIFGLTTKQMEDSVEKERPLATPMEMDLYIAFMEAETGLTEIAPTRKVARTPREILQFFGTDYVRAKKGDYWIQRLIAECAQKRRVLIADVRFPDEADALRRSLDATVIRVVRIDAPLSVDAHPSETMMDQIVPDLEVGTRTEETWELQRRVARLVGRGRPHQALKYDYRNIRKMCDRYCSGDSLESCARGDLGSWDVATVKAVLSYYGIPLRGNARRFPAGGTKVVDGEAGKRCVRCETFKALAEFNKNQRARDGFQVTCRACASEYNRARDANPSLSSFVTKIRRMARYRNLPFELTTDDVREILDRQSWRCWYTDVVMTTKPRDPNKATLDRIDSSVGYIKGNVVAATRVANCMKSDMSVAEFLAQCEAVVRTAGCRG